MSKQCAKCSKTVYPTEELKCLDKVWHRGCFRCSECGMTLNMKNYKGYDKLPYCNAHYPKTKHTVVADTPEGRRIAENTKIQSQIGYHSDFEKAKGHCIQIADDPEMQRMKKSQEAVSLVRYHEEFEKNIKGSKIQVADDPEMSRIRQNTALQSQVEYKNLRGIAAEMEQRRANIGDGGGYRPSSSSYQTQEWEESIPDPRAAEPRQQHYPAPQQYQPPAPQQPQQPSYQPPAPQQPSYQPPPQQPPPQQQAPPAQPPAPANPMANAVFKAMYDYEAADDDEVSFQDGDNIVEIEMIDDGWMYGTVRRTKKRGMLPANYVERVQ